VTRHQPLTAGRMTYAIAPSRSFRSKTRGLLLDRAFASGEGSP